MLERLHTHLATLRRAATIDAWYDREVLAGGDIDREIADNLRTSRLFLALVSPDFLNSTYCYEAELQSAIRMHEAGAIVVLPIILEPCDWQESPLGKFKALPTDGKPISDWPNINSAFLDVVKELRRLVQSMSSEKSVEQPPVIPVATPGRSMPSTSPARSSAARR